MNYLVKNEKYALLATPEYPMGPALKLYRLVAMRNIGSAVKAGDHGGWLSGPSNLSPEGDCWVYSGSAAHSGARVMDDAQVVDNAAVIGPVVLRERSSVVGRLALMGAIELKGNETLHADFAFVVNLPLYRKGQFMKNGETFFIMDFLIGDGPAHSILLKANECSDYLAAHLCSREVGDTVSFAQMGQGPHEVIPRQADGSLSAMMVKAVLPVVQKGV